MKKQSPLFQSAIATLLFFSSSSQGAFLSTASKCSGRGILLESQRNIKPSSAFAFASAHTIQQTNYSTTSRKSTTNDINTSILSGTPPSAEGEDEGLLIPYRDGSHGSVKIIMDDDETGLYSTDSSNALSVEDFKNRLLNTIETCKQLNKKSLWIQVPMSKARYIEACTDIPGLEFHHTESGTAHLALWLKQDIENKIPEYATHQVGVGAIVVNSKSEVLCVRELRKNFRKWKIPGGLADLGEQLNEAAIREVKEETGIDCRFKSVLGFRHSHSAQFGRSDMYFVCRLEPIEEDDGTLQQQPVAQKGEIAAAAWVPLQEYKDMINGKGDDADPHPMMQKMMELHDLNWEQSDIQRTVVNSIVPGRKSSPVYHAAGSNSS
jgi:ADP-ribose pyrophosphatase YjhB (NUDIX family)